MLATLSGGSTPLSGFAQIIVIVVAGVVLLLIPFVVKFLVRMSGDVSDIKDLLSGREPSRLEPEPPIGLVKTVDGLVTTAESVKTAVEGNGHPVN